MCSLHIPRVLAFGLFFLSLIIVIHAQDAGLFVEGGLEDATVNDDTYNSGGTISLNGFTITVPRNLLVQFPAAYVPWREFVDDKSSMLGYEIIAIGNFINGNPIAGQIQVMQFVEGLNSGFIESVNMSEGTLKILSGPTIRINDPNAVFSVGYTADPKWTADDESPSITAFSGFPMCIPRNTTDPLCPASNRPFSGSGTFTAPDPLVMAPFLPGDFITYMGLRRGDEFIAFNIVAQNVQILTLQNLVYLRTELGKLGISNFNPNVEIAESRFVGFTSSSRATVNLYAMDIDPCTGNTTDRIVAAVGLRGGANEQNRFEYRSDILGGYARDYKVVAEIAGIERTRITKNNLLAGSYMLPVDSWIHGEQNIPGTAPP